VRVVVRSQAFADEEMSARAKGVESTGRSTIQNSLAAEDAFAGGNLGRTAQNHRPPTGWFEAGGHLAASGKHPTSVWTRSFAFVCSSQCESARRTPLLQRECKYFGLNEIELILDKAPDATAGAGRRNLAVSTAKKSSCAEKECDFQG
jgi:hypothetical protein